MSNTVAVPSNIRSTKRLAIVISIVVIVAILFWLFPLFHIVRLDEAQRRQKQNAFDAAASAQSFWNDQLLTSLGRAADVQQVLSLASANSKQVRAQFGHAVGSSRTYYLFLRGSGKITAIEKHGVKLLLDGEPADREVVLETGPIFGNTVRDAAGLLNPSNYSNSQQLNSLSTELNRIVETKVLPDLQAAKIGSHLQFVGGAEISNEAKDFQPLSIVPIQVKID